MTNGHNGKIESVFAPTPKPVYKERGLVSYIFGSGRVAGVVIPVFLFFILVAIVWYSYPKSGDDKIVPIIQADPSPYRYVPSDKGGMKFEHQDSEIFNFIDNNSSKTSVEKLVSVDIEDPVSKTELSKHVLDLSKKEPKLNLNLKLEQTGKAVENIIAREETIPLSELKKRLKNPDKILKSKLKKEDVIVAGDSNKKMAKTVTKPISGTDKIKTKVVKASTINNSKKVIYNKEITGKWTVQLGAFSKKDAVVKAWKEESRKYPTIMAGIGYSIQEAKRGTKTLYRLRVGNFTTREKAAIFCKKLKAKGGSCIVAK